MRSVPAVVISLALTARPQFLCRLLVGQPQSTIVAGFVRSLLCAHVEPSGVASAITPRSSLLPRGLSNGEVKNQLRHMRG